MTAKERGVIQKQINRLTELQAEQDRHFKALQTLNTECGDGHRWCSVDACLRGVSQHGDERQKDRATWIYRQFFEAGAKMDLLRDLGQELADIGFWKHGTK